MKPKGDSVTKLRRILEAQIQRPVPLGNNRAKGRFLLFTSATIFVLTHYPKLSALDRVVDACERHGKTAGYLVNTIEEGTEMLRRGFRCIAYGGDLWLYRRALAEGIEGLRTSVWRR